MVIICPCCQHSYGNFQLYILHDCICLVQPCSRNSLFTLGSSRCLPIVDTTRNDIVRNVQAECIDLTSDDDELINISSDDEVMDINVNFNEDLDSQIIADIERYLPDLNELFPDGIDLAQYLDPVQQLQSFDPINHLQPSDPVQQLQSFDPINEIQPSDPVQQLQSFDPINEIQPSDPVQQLQSFDPINQLPPSDPVQQLQSFDPINEIQPSDPVQQLQPFDPINEIQPSDPVRQNQPFDPIEQQQTFEIFQQRLNELFAQTLDPRQPAPSESIQSQSHALASQLHDDLNHAHLAYRPSTSRNFVCNQCRKRYTREAYLNSHMRLCHPIRAPIDQSLVPGIFGSLNLHSSAFGGHYVVYRHEVDNGDVDILVVVGRLLDQTVHLLEHLIGIFHCLKFGIAIKCLFYNPLLENDAIRSATFQSPIDACFLGTDKKSSILEKLGDIQVSIDQFTARGSGWILVNIELVDIFIGKYVPHRGGCVNHKPPQFISNKCCLLSIKTRSDCFMYSVLSALHPMRTHPERAAKYRQFTHLYDFSDVRGDVSVADIPKFERKNDISINVYSLILGTRTIVPLAITKENKIRHVNLFLHDGHYFLIKHFNRFASKQGLRNRYFCFRCLFGFPSQQKLDDHLSNCLLFHPQTVVLPSAETSILKRKDFRKEMRFPVTIYADFETLNVKLDDPLTIADLIPCSYGYVAINWENEIIYQDFGFGENIGERFMNSLYTAESWILNYIQSSKKPLLMSPSDEENFQSSTTCHICGNLLTDPSVRDHDHMTGVYRGAAHVKCNLEYRLPGTIPVLFHNLKNFDGHIIIKSINRNNLQDRVPQLIPHTIEKYIGFTIGRLRFLDSFAFLPASLDKLSASLETVEKERYLHQLFANVNVTPLTKKCILPYEYLDSLEKFEETSLPDKSEFKSSLTDSEISDEQYEHVKEIWQSFNCTKLLDLHDIYLKVDVLLLAAVFENFRSTSIENFNIDPLHHYSAPGLTWAAALKVTRIELQLFTDIEMLLMIEKGIRGGLTMVSNRHVIPNNPASSDYQADRTKSYILYLDVNNLYGYAMSERLPVDGYEWCTIDDNFLTHVLSCSDDSDVGFILEVDLSYPNDLHDEHNDFPMAPHKMLIRPEIYSPYQKDLLEVLTGVGLSNVSTTKLVTTFYTKRNYVIHYRTLKFYVQNGLKVEKVHRGVKFNQRPWLYEYVDFCTQKRTTSTTDFQKDFWKLMVNSLYGKTIEDKRKHINVELALNDIHAARALRKNHSQRFLILEDDKVIFEMKKLKVKMDKPIAVGFTVLELAKLKMYQLHYETFKQHYGPNIELIYTDTDSLIYHIKTEDLVDDLQGFASIMDFSNYPTDHRLYSSVNKKKIGYLKDECPADPITEFVGLRPKLYALKTSNSITKKAKGVPRSVLSHKIDFDAYTNSLYSSLIHCHSFIRINSREHNIQMIKQKKICITPFEDKRYLIDNTKSYAYGHYRISN